MCRLLFAFLVIAIINCVLSRSARTDATVLRVPILPSIVAPLPVSMLTTVTRPDGSATWSAAALTPVDHSFLGRAARLLDGLRRPVSGNPGATVWRNPSQHDPARDRDATSFGIRSAPISPSGAIFGGVGVLGGAAQLLDLVRVVRNLPVKLTPTTCQGGAGVAVKGRW